MTCPSKQRRVLAFDPGTNLIGWVLLIDGVVRDHNTIDISKRGNLAFDRLPAAYEELQAVFDLTDPTHVAYEGLANGGQLTTIITHAAIHAIIELLSRWRRIFPIKVAPTQVKMHMVGKGGGPETKKQFIIQAAIPHFAPDLPTEHEADALGVGLFADDRIQGLPLPPKKKPAPRKKKEAS